MRSAQSSVFYVTKVGDPNHQIVLKIYKNDDIKSYYKEIAVFKKIAQMNHNLPEQSKIEDFGGFPALVSNLENHNQAEILMEALGPNLRKLLKQCPGKVFSKTSIYMITIQLVSRLIFFFFDFGL